MELFFSIITPCYNRQDEILLLIDSIINQSVSPNQYELIIVDDGSTDNSRNIIENKIIDSNINIRLITINFQHSIEWCTCSLHGGSLWVQLTS